MIDSKRKVSMEVAVPVFHLSDCSAGEVEAAVVAAVGLEDQNVPSNRY